MASFEATQLIDAPREDVYAYRLNVHTLPEYNPDVSGVRLARGDGARDSRYRFDLKLGPGVRVNVELTVTACEQPERIAFSIDSIGMKATEECTFAAEGEGTRVTFKTSVASPPLGPLKPLLDRLFVVPNMKRQTLRELDLMKARLERRA